MQSTLAKLTAHAQLIPSGNVAADVECLSELLTQSKIYFEFVFSRFQLLANTPEAITVIKRIINAEKNPDVYLPFFGILLNNLQPVEIAEFLTPIIFLEKSADLVYYMMAHPNVSVFIKDVCLSMFNVIPDLSKLHVRDDILLRALGLGIETDFAIKCMERIPILIDTEFYQEFILFLTYFIEMKTVSKELVALAINAAVSLPDPEFIIQLLADGDFPIPALFAEWIEQNIEDPPNFDKQRLYTDKIENLPTLLRIQVVKKAPKAMDTPRFCRALKNLGGFTNEQHRRIISETDPQKLHDLIIANPEMIPLARNVPFRFTLFALACAKDPKHTNSFLSEFCSVTPNDPEELQFAASKALSTVSLRNPVAVTRVFPHIRLLLRTCSRRTQIELYNALAAAAAAGALHSGFLWREYKTVRTVTDDDYDQPGLLAACVNALADADDAPIACEILKKLSTKDLRGVQESLLTVPKEIIEKYPEALSLRPKVFPEPNPKTDNIALIVRSELEKPQTITRKMLIATAAVAFFDAFEFADVPYIKFLSRVGRAAFERSTGMNNEVIEATKSDKMDMRFAALFALSVLEGYKLINLQPLSDALKDIAISDRIEECRLAAFYALSKTHIEAPARFIQGVIARSSNSETDMIGIGYCVTEWFSQLATYLKQLRAPSGLWPAVAEAVTFIGSIPSINEKDKDSIAQYLFLTRENPATDAYADLLATVDITLTQLVRATLGAVPSLAFSPTPFHADSRQLKMMDATIGDDFDLFKAIVTRPRLPHKFDIDEDIKGSASTIEQLRDSWRSLSTEQTKMLIASLSPMQLSQLKFERNDGALFTAAFTKDADAVALHLCERTVGQEMYDIIRRYMPQSDFEIAQLMLEKGAGVGTVAVLLCFFKLGEILGEGTAAPLVPVIAAEERASAAFLLALARHGAPPREIAGAAIIKVPNLFYEQSDSYKELFKLFG